MTNDKLGLIILDNCQEIGRQIDEYLQKVNRTDKSYIIPIEQVRFDNGEGKVVIKNSVQDKSIFIISDIGNHSQTYKMFDYENHMSPDDHFQDIKRVISAMSGNAAKISIVMPLLYSSRQHKRKGRESLDCAIALQELEKLGTDAVVTFDVHDPNVQNAVPCLSFKNLYPTYIILEDFIRHEKIDLDKMLVISPDAGAIDRAIYYADILGSDVGIFNKRRDLSVVVDGHNPIVSHEYIGRDVAGCDVIVVDDMIASGSSILEVAGELKQRGARKIYLICTFALLTKGTERFEKAHQDGYIDKVYATNLSYVPPVASSGWLKIVDCSHAVADAINALYHHDSLSMVFEDKRTAAVKFISKFKKDLDN